MMSVQNAPIGIQRLSEEWILLNLAAYVEISFRKVPSSLLTAKSVVEFDSSQLETGSDGITWRRRDCVTWTRSTDRNFVGIRCCHADGVVVERPVSASFGDVHRTFFTTTLCREK